MRPLKSAPSSMLIRAATISPITLPPFLISTRSHTSRLPETSPKTTTSLAVTSEVNCAVHPTVSRWPRSETGPSTLPSICKSSSPEIWPLTVRDDPRHSKLRTGELIGLPKRIGGAGALNGVPEVFNSCDEDDSGISVFVWLVHIVPLIWLWEWAGVSRTSVERLYGGRQAGLFRNGPGLFACSSERPDRPVRERILGAFGRVATSALT